MVALPIKFDTQDKGSRLLWVPNPEIDKKATDANLWNDVVADALRFKGIASVLKNALDWHVLHAKLVARVVSGWEHDKRSVVELSIGERDQAVMSRTIMPPQPSDWLVAVLRHIKNALRFCNECDVVIAILVIQRALKE